MRFLKRRVALPSDHGSWIFLLSPLLIGLLAGKRWSVVSLYLVVAALAGFLIRQPATLAVKAYSGRRPRDELPVAWFWITVYAAIGLVHVLGLILRGFGDVLYLAIPAVPVFLWYLYLVSLRAERRQLVVELLATGALGLTAPAAMWVGVGSSDPAGWLLWLLVWAQSAASILHAYMRLEQRGLPAPPDLAARLRSGIAPLLQTAVNLLGVVALCLDGALPRWLFVPYLVQWVETLWGALVPAIGAKPRAIGLRQLAVSALFTLLFIWAWAG